jgi:hypothetical protein
MMMAQPNFTPAYTRPQMNEMVLVPVSPQLLNLWKFKGAVEATNDSTVANDAAK